MQAMAASDSTFGLFGAGPDKRDFVFAAYMMIAGVLLMVALALMYRLHRFITLELDMRRRNIAFTLYPPKGAEYAEGDVHTVCAICITEFHNYARVAVLACGHIFHRHCLREEVARENENPRCPLCRAAVA